MHKVEKKDYIMSQGYKTLCDSIFDDNEELSAHTGVHDSGVVYVPMDKIFDFFRMAENMPDIDYIVVSGLSDYGIVEQKSNPVDLDMVKWIRMLSHQMSNWNNGQPYAPLLIPSRCNQHLCKITDKYSVKMYSFTNCTFDKIPSNIKHWFAANVDKTDFSLDTSRFTRIPFGIAEWSKPEFSEEKEDKVYVNFMINTAERLSIYNHFSTMPEAVLKMNQPHNIFFNDISKYRFIVCPEGNGFDSYRILETIYSGSIPVVQNRDWSKVYSDLPVIFVENLQKLEYSTLVQEYHKLLQTNISLESATMQYWLDKINSKRGLINK